MSHGIVPFRLHVRAALGAAVIVAASLLAPPLSAQTGPEVFPHPLELSFFPECACNQKDLIPPGDWMVKYTYAETHTALGSSVEHEGSDELYLRDDILKLRRSICGERFFFPQSGSIILHFKISFMPDGAGAYKVAPWGYTRFGTDIGELRPVGDLPPKKLEGELERKNDVHWSKYRFNLTFMEGRTPGLKDSPVMQRIARLAGRTPEDWPELACWCREVEQSYAASYIQRQTFLDPAHLAEAGAEGAFAGDLPRFRGAPDWEALDAGIYGTYRTDTAPGQNYQTRANRAANTALMVADYAPLDLIYSAPGFRPVGGTTLEECRMKVHQHFDSVPVTIAATHVHEEVHVADCLRAKQAYEASRGRDRNTALSTPLDFATAWFNTPALLADTEARAYAADMRFLLQFHKAHCQPIVEDFKLK